MQLISLFSTRCHWFTLTLFGANDSFLKSLQKKNNSSKSQHQTTNILWESFRRVTGNTQSGESSSNKGGKASQRIILVPYHSILNMNACSFVHSLSDHCLILVKSCICNSNSGPCNSSEPMRYNKKNLCNKGGIKHWHCYWKFCFIFIVVKFS